MSAPSVAIVYPVPMPYTFPVLRLLAQSRAIELTVLYSRRSLPARGQAPEPSIFEFPHTFLADAGHVFVGRDVREIDVNPGLPRALTRLRTELVVVSGFVQPTALLGIAWAILHRRPYGLCVESHDLIPRPRVKSLVRRRLLAPIIRRAAVLLPTGEAAAQSLAALGGLRARTVLFPHVPDPAFFHARARDVAAAELRGRLGLEEKTPVLAFAGRLVESKGVETLIQAHREVHARTGAQLVVAGAGPLEGALRESQVAGVSFLGFLDPHDVGMLLRAADIALSPSLVEPWGTFVLEAAASGCPVVASDVVPSAVELIGRSGAGKLVAPGDAEGLATALVELLADREALSEMSRRAIAVSSAYTPERAAASFLEGVRTALEQEPAR
jgi:glycosyltransferase involved in cell wall biosynthesis